jgi:hypothetical protein
MFRSRTVSSQPVLRTALALFALFADLLRLLRLMLGSRARLAAENLFLRKQLACYLERQVRPRRTDNASRIALVLLSHFVDWRELLTIVRPETLVRWHRDLFRLFWRLKSRRRGRPRIAIEVQRLIADMATHNHTWGEERIAAELRVKLGLTVSPRTVRRYMPPRPRGRGGRSAQSWATFVHNHAGSILACDFFIVVTATFQRVCVFVLLDIGTRRVVHWNLTDHPRSEWTIQQFRNGLPLDGTYRFLVHDRDGTSSDGTPLSRRRTLRTRVARSSSRRTTTHDPTSTTPFIGCCSRPVRSRPASISGACSSRGKTSPAPIASGRPSTRLATSCAMPAGAAGWDSPLESMRA